MLLHDEMPPQICYMQHTAAAAAEPTTNQKMNQVTQLIQANSTKAGKEKTDGRSGVVWSLNSSRRRYTVSHVEDRDWDLTVQYSAPEGKAKRESTGVHAFGGGRESSCGAATDGFVKRSK
jgi:hypothetical protein